MFRPKGETGEPGQEVLSENECGAKRSTKFELSNLTPNPTLTAKTGALPRF